jgi:hypothetical protein
VDKQILLALMTLDDDDGREKKRYIGESPLNRNDPKSEQYSLDLLKRVIPKFQSVWRHRSELGFVPVKGTLPYNPLSVDLSIIDVPQSE